MFLVVVFCRSCEILIITSEHFSEVHSIFEVAFKQQQRKNSVIWLTKFTDRNNQEKCTVAKR